MTDLDLSRLTVLGDICTNHNGDVDVAKEMIAAISGIGCIPKIQLFSEETFPRTWVHLLPPHGFIPSVFQPGDVDFILPHRPLALKIASVEATYEALVDRCLGAELPLIISTGGMSEDEFIALAEKTQFIPDICFMHCVSRYPTEPADLQLRRLELMDEILNDLDHYGALGLSSHYPDADLIMYYSAAMALNSTVFEAHVYLDDYAGPTTADTLASISLSKLFAVKVQLAQLSLSLDTEISFEGIDREDVLRWRQRWQK